MLTGSRPFLFFIPPHQRGGWRWEGAELRQLPITDHRHLECLVFVFPSHCHMQWSSAFLGLTRSACHWEAVNAFLVLLCLHEQFLLYLLNCLPSQPTTLLTSPILSPIPQAAEWVNGWVGLSCWLGSKHIQKWTTAKACKLKTKKK